MKFLKKLQTSTSSKNKKKKQKKKKKAQAAGTNPEGEAPKDEAVKSETPSTVETSQPELKEETDTKSSQQTEVTQQTSQNLSQTKNTEGPEETKTDPSKEENSQASTKVEEEEKKLSDEHTVPEGEMNSEDWSYTLKWKGHINVKLDKNTRIKIVDFGNACWVHKHFTDNIQTREYRSPEAILGIPYKENTDIWSLACVIFEMITSNFLFKPKKKEHYSKDDDHLALMQEHLGKMPKSFALSGKHSRDFFNKNGQLIRIKDLRETSIAEALLEEREDLDEIEAYKIESFLLPMLEYDPDKRISAREALEHEWLWT